MGVWQMALQKLGCSCHMNALMPATTTTAAMTPPTTAPRRGRLAAGFAATDAEPTCLRGLLFVFH